MPTPRQPSIYVTGFPYEKKIEVVQLDVVNVCFVFSWKLNKSGPKPDRCDMMLYNKDKSIQGYILPSEQVYDDLFKAGKGQCRIGGTFRTLL